MTVERSLPSPESDELFSVLGPSNLRALYGWLYRRQSSNPPTEAELKMFMTDAMGEAPDDCDRRLNELGRHFDIAWTDDANGRRRIELRGWSDSAPSPEELQISSRLRAEVLMPQRCFQCGRTPKDHEVVLDVDFKIPRSWGGGTEIENLQPMCENCLEGKRDYLQSFEALADKIRLAINYPEPQRRIGELLLAFGSEWVRSDLLAMVASAQEYQEDWQRRLRDLRFLGWDYESKRRTLDGSGRVWVFYRLVKSAPWPSNIHDAIISEAERRKALKTR
jgi:hypothetical protein